MSDHTAIVVDGTRKAAMLRDNAERSAIVGKVRALAAEGLSASTIAGLIGKSRNAVIGICHRNGVQLKGRVRKAYKRGRKTAAPSAANNKTQLRSVTQWPQSTEPLQPMRAKVIAPPADRKSLKEVHGHRLCRWIEGDVPDDTSQDTPLYCGGVGHPWCEYHRGKVFEARRRR